MTLFKANEKDTCTDTRERKKIILASSELIQKGDLSRIKSRRKREGERKRTKCVAATLQLLVHFIREAFQKFLNLVLKDCCRDRINFVLAKKQVQSEERNHNHLDICLSGAQERLRHFFITIL